MARIRLLTSRLSLKCLELRRRVLCNRKHLGIIAIIKKSLRTQSRQKFIANRKRVS